MDKQEIENTNWHFLPIVSTPFLWSKSSTINSPPSPPSPARLTVTKVNILGNNFPGSFYNIINQGASNLNVIRISFQPQQLQSSEREYRKDQCQPEELGRRSYDVIVGCWGWWRCPRWAVDYCYIVTWTSPTNSVRQTASPSTQPQCFRK